ncbi:MAG: DUF979 domain-containing protein [Rhizomicrobium sp.]|jgi:uncharacterized membrane protein
MITLQYFYILAGLLFAAFALLSVGDGTNRKRLGNTAFWGLLAVSFLGGSSISDFANGLIVLALVALGGFGALGIGKPATTSPAERLESAVRRGNNIFLPALVIPAVAVLGTLFLKTIHVGGMPLVDAKQVTLISLALGAVLALAAAMIWLRPPVLAPLQEGRRIVDTIGWAAILPQMLASLGAIFALAHVGDAVREVATGWIPLELPFAAVCAYCLGMALFTIIMGNAFAAFPVMTAAIGLPLIVHKFGGNPAIMGAIGMLSGFCGTLMTPMAANFNIVPAALLELPDRNSVIKAQIPTAIPLLMANTLLMYFLVFRF